VRQLVGLVREVFNFAMATSADPEDSTSPRLFAGENPAAASRFVNGSRKHARPDNRIRRVLMPDEWVRLQELARAYSREQWLAHELGYHTGMRRGEIVGLRRHQVSPLGRTIIPVDTKTGRDRVVHYGEELDKAIGILLATPGNILFEGKKGQGRDPQSITRGFARLAGEDGMNDGIDDARFLLTFKSLRATYAVRMLAGGASLKDVSVQLGHATVDMTVERYLPLVEAYQREALARAGRRAAVLDFVTPHR
jgi:integrase